MQSSTNRYTAIGGNAISHDDAGNLTVDKDGYQYTYDYENRVVKIEDSSSNDVAEYAYDALGRRIRSNCKSQFDKRSQSWPDVRERIHCRFIIVGGTEEWTGQR